MKTFAIFNEENNQIICIFNAEDGDGVDVTDYSNLQDASAAIGSYLINVDEKRFDLRPDNDDYQLTLIENDARNKRNILLLKSDWTQNPDVNVDKEAWAQYRADLRDITNQPGFPTDIIWPQEPKG